ncbi:MAG: Bax inhibitor-1/YccA family protein [Alphaproteobacteria bacterium]|nr:Bax inhibitor-1/YccA family protein [Alphaproteobacteria bacterium]MDE2336683.1 Bax inhibitor-1/YccA family protein [Alphaproteobacteria bacterium]
MSYDPYNNPSSRVGYQGAVIDAGLQSYMRGVYHTMGIGLVLTGLSAFAVANIPALFHLIFGTPFAYVAMFAPLAFLWFGFTPARMARMPSQKLATMFSLFSVLMGLSLASIFIVYSGASIARVFFITAATFAATSLYGYTTKRDLAGAGSFLFMGLIGIVIASIVNVFMHSAMVQFVVSILGVVIFTGLTAWETQNLKATYRAGADEANAKMALIGALNLYLNFINLFMILLQFSGNRR